jgi:hypothetical protein
LNNANQWTQKAVSLISGVPDVRVGNVALSGSAPRYALIKKAERERDEKESI